MRDAVDRLSILRLDARTPRQPSLVVVHGARSAGACTVAPWTDQGSQRARAVVPFVHAGMEAVAPRGAALPVAGQAVSVLVGPPVPVADLLAAAAAGAWPDERLYGAIAARVGAALAALKAQLDGLPADLVRLRVLGRGCSAAARPASMRGVRVQRLRWWLSCKPEPCWRA